VVAIIGILAAIAIPQYQDYVLRANIQEATSTLSDFRTRMEQSYQDNRTYAGAAGPAGCALADPAPTARWAFACTLPVAGGQTFLVTAIGASTMLNFSYDINEANVRNSTVNARWGGTTATRWVTSKGG
jgi:type IV pilus assembly protein PilE